MQISGLSNCVDGCVPFRNGKLCRKSTLRTLEEDQVPSSRRVEFVCFFVCFAVLGPLTATASPVADHRLRTRRLSSHGSRAQPLRGMWDLPGPGHEPVSPESAGGLSTTAPPGKPFCLVFILLCYFLKNLYDKYTLYIETVF